LLIAAKSEEAIGLLRTVITERQRYPGIGEIYHQIIPHVRTTIGQLFAASARVSTQCDTPEFLADLFLAVMVVDEQLAILIGLADGPEDEQRVRRMRQRLSILFAIGRAVPAAVAKQG
jgi:hypothetical protein